MHSLRGGGVNCYPLQFFALSRDTLIIIIIIIIIITKSLLHKQ